ncbi:MAG TPA: hypothetical protein VFA70_15180 [Dehalococcoidia bacterium]|nr:hypothetical protein [Dehalococcoidia bacterium]
MRPLLTNDDGKIIPWPEVFDDDPTMELSDAEAAERYRLRQAATLLAWFQESLAERLASGDPQMTDEERRIAEAFLHSQSARRQARG